MDRRANWGALLIGMAALAIPTATAAAPLNGPSLLIASPDMLGTRAIPIRADRFADSLRRAREDATSSPLLQRMVAPAATMQPLQKMAFVQAAVTRSIRWISDATEWGQHDYWASAAQTLAHGAGDAKNRAIVKLQALRALGFNNSDLFLTLARDQVGGPITVLTVRNGGHYYVMDDTGGRPFTVEERRREFQPLMSFGMYGAWVHMPRTTLAPSTLVAASATTSGTARK
jgi:predicted transglutaminase-like cysteine proteinase